MSSSTIYHGSCLCGRITFELQEEPKIVTCCHCWNCRKSTGVGSQQNIIFSDSELRITKGEEFRSAYEDGKQDSGLALFRHFCSKCGANLFITRRALSGVEKLPKDKEGGDEDMASVFYSAVDWRVTKNEDGGEVKEKFEVPPAIEFHVRDKLPWVELIKGAGQFHTKPETFTLTR